MITQDGPSSRPIARSFVEKAGLVEAVRRYYRGVFAGDLGVSQSIWMYEGDKIRLSGDPLRQITFADGTAYPVVDNDPEAGDDAKLIAPSVRAKTLTSASRN